MSSYFEPTSAVAACRAESIMTMPIDELAQVAWPLLSDAERTLSMRDVLFTPPLRVSASPRATEAVFAAGIQSCLTELTSNLASVDYGDTPLSVARLRAHALAYHIAHAAAPWGQAGPHGARESGQRSTSANAASSPLQLDAGAGTAPSLLREEAEALLDFALPSFATAALAEESETAPGPAASAAAAADVEGGRGVPSGDAEAAAGARRGVANAIYSSAHNTPPEAPHAALRGGADTGEPANGPRARPASAGAAVPPPGGADRASRQHTSAAEQASYARKTRSLVAKYVDEQWASVIASAVVSDDRVNSASGHPAESSAAAQQLRGRILRTALYLCHVAPTSAEAGYSFVCLLKHALAAVGATSAIRHADAGALHDGASPPAVERGGGEAVQRPGGLSATAATASAAFVSSSGSSVVSASSPDEKTTTTAAAAAAGPQQDAAAALQASLLVEVVLPLLHCVSLVRWPEDVLAELGQVLGGVVAAPPAKLAAVAQQQQRERQRRGQDSATARSSAASSAAKAGVKKSRPLDTKSSEGSPAEQRVDFTVRVPFMIGLPMSASAKDEMLRALYHGSGNAATAADAGQQLPHQPPPQQQLSLTNESATSAAGNNESSYPSSAFHEVPDMTEEMSVVDEEEEEEANDSEYTTASDDDESSEETGSSGNGAAGMERASALNVSVDSDDDDDSDNHGGAGAFGGGFGGPRGDFEAQPCRRRRTRMIELSFPGATRVSVRLLEAVDWEHTSQRGRDVLLLPLETTASGVDKSESPTLEERAVPTEQPSPSPIMLPAAAGAEATAAEATTITTTTTGSSSRRKKIGKEVLPLSLQSTRTDRNEALTCHGPCRVAIPTMTLEEARLVPGEVSAQLQLTLDVRWGTEWQVALAAAQRTTAERLLTWLESRTQTAASETQQRRHRIAGSVLLCGGLRGGAAALAESTPATVSAAAAPPSASSSPLCDPFLSSLLEMPLTALRARVRCHTVHADGVRATLLVVAHALLQDRHGYLHGDPLTWHTAAWSETVRRVSLASNSVGAAAVSGEAAMAVALFFIRHVVGGCTAATTPRAQVIDAAIELMSTPGLSLAELKAALEERLQVSSAMWATVNLLSKASATLRTPKHVTLISQATRRLLLLGCHSSNAAASASSQHPHPPAHLSTTTSGAAAAASAPSTASVAAVSSGGHGAAAHHYLTHTNGSGRAAEANLRRGVHGLLTQLFRLLKALLHRIQSSQAAPHRFLLESWEYGAFAVYTVSLLSAPMDAADVQLCAPFFAEVVTGLLPSFTRLSRTESLLLTTETAEHKFLLEVAKHVRGRGSASGEGGNAELGEADTPASREPHIVRRVEETASSTSSTTTANGEGVGVWDVLQGATAASWTPGHVRVEIWNGGCSGFYVGLASAELPADVCGPDRDPGGIYFMGDGTLQYGDVTRRQRRLPRWHAGDVVELSFIFASGCWDVVMALNGVSLVRLTLPRRDFRLVAVNVRAGAYVPGHNHVHVVSVLPVHGKSGAAVADRRRRPSAPSASPSAAAVAANHEQQVAAAVAAPAADVRLSPFSRPTVFNVSLFLELVLHYLMLHSSRQHAPSLLGASAATAAAGAGAAAVSVGHATARAPLRRAASSAGLAGTHDHAADAAVTPLPVSAAEGANLVQACMAPLQRCVQQLVQLLQDLASSAADGGPGDEAAAYEVKRTAARHITNAMLLDLVVTLSISLPYSAASLATAVEVLTAVVECESVSPKAQTVALSALYNAISPYAAGEASPSLPASALRRLWTACCRLASAKPGYQPRFSAASVPAASVVVLAGGRRIEHRRVTVGSTTLAGNVRSVSYACNPIELDDPATPEVVRVSVRLQRGFPCETLGRYYFCGFADVASSPASTPGAQSSSAAVATPSSSGAAASRELTRHPGDRAKQRHTYYISDYLSEVPEGAVQKADTERAKNSLNPDNNILFGSGDVVTLVLFVRERCVGFERNGTPLNVLYRNIPATVTRLYPFVELYNRDSRAKWMYAPDEAQMSARYTMRAMLRTWPQDVCPLIKEHLPHFDYSGFEKYQEVFGSQGQQSPLPTHPSTAAAAVEEKKDAMDRIDTDLLDVLLGVLGADGDEMRMVYVPPPQLDQPSGRARAVRIERFERGMAVVSDEAGSLQRVCAAALEPDVTQSLYTTAGRSLLSVVLLCAPELITFAAQCMRCLAEDTTAAEGGAKTSAQSVTDSSAPLPGPAAAATTRRVTLRHPATLLRALRLILSAGTHQRGGVSAAEEGSGPALPLAGEAGLQRSTVLAATQEPVERAMRELVPLLDAVLPAAQLALPPQVLLREAWNELCCNPTLREQLEVTVLAPSQLCVMAGDGEGQSVDAVVQEGSTDGSAAGLSAAAEESDGGYTESASTTYATSARRFDDRLRGQRAATGAGAAAGDGGGAALCPTCGEAWSACAGRHTAPSSWCDLLDRVLRRLQKGTRSSSSQRSISSSPYCGWFTSWTDAPLSALAGKPAAASPASPPVAADDHNDDDDRDYHSPASAQSSDAEAWEDADETSEEAGEGDEEQEEAVQPQASDSTMTTASSHSGEEEEEEERGTEAVDVGLLRQLVENAFAAAVADAGAAPPGSDDDEAPITLTVRRATAPAGTTADNADTVYVEGSGETRQASFTFTGTLLSATALRGQMTFDHANVPDPEGEASATQEWACPLCTFLNEPAAVRCAICANARPGASWACPVCSYAYNTLSSATCVTCGCMRPSSVRRQQDAGGLSAHCMTCKKREHFRNFHAMRHRRHCAACGKVTRWLPKDKFSTTIEARLVGDGGTLEFQWSLDGCNTICFGLRTRAYNADELWTLVEAAARRRGSTAVREVGQCVPPIPERPLSKPPTKPNAVAASATAAPPAGQPCMVGAMVYYASALVLHFAHLFPPRHLVQPNFLRRLHVCDPAWLSGWASFPLPTAAIYAQCLKLLRDGVREPELVSTLARVAVAIIEMSPASFAAQANALLYALCLNVIRYGDNAQREVSYGTIAALLEEEKGHALNAQPLVPVLSMEPLVEGQQRITVLALLRHVTMPSTPAIAKACACMARTMECMLSCQPLPPMLGKPFPYLVALTETRLNEGGELLVGQVRGSVGAAPTKGGKYYYEVEVPHEFAADRSKTIVMGWGTVEHERIASAQHVGSDLHSWGFNCRDHLRLMMTEQALPVPRRPSQGDVIGSMIDLETMMVCWTINGQEISWVSVPAQGDGEEIFPYVSASVEPQSVRIRLGNTRFKPAGYQDYTPPSDRDLWAPEARSHGAADGATPAHRPQSYAFYQQLSRALEEASITTLEDAALLSLLDTSNARSVLRQYPLVRDVMTRCETDGQQRQEGRSASPAADVQLLVPYIQYLRRTQDLTIVVARHLSLIEQSPSLMAYYQQAIDLLFSSGRWTIFELQPGGRPKYSGGHAFRVLVSARKAKHVRKEADAEWLAQHPQHQQPLVAEGSLSVSLPSPTHHEGSGGSSALRRGSDRRAGAAAGATSEGESSVRDREGDEDDDEEAYEDVRSDSSGNDDDDGGEEDELSGGRGESSLTELRNTLQDIYGDNSHLSLAERRLRCTVTGQLFAQLEKTRVYQRARMFAVQLEGTLAVDAGGVTRSVMSMVGEEVSFRFVRGVRVDPLLPLFQLCSHSTIFTVVPNMSAFHASEAADDGAEGGVLRRMFEWLGKLLGNMVLCGTLKVPFDFPRLLWKTLTFQEKSITLADYAYDIDDNITAALEDDEFVLSDDFFASLPEHVRASPAFLRCLHGGTRDAQAGDAGAGGVGGGGHHVGLAAARPLRPYVCMTPAMSMQDMSHLALEELEEYAADAEAAEVSRRRALAQEALLHQYDPALLAIRAGLTAVVPAASLRAVRWEDLRARVCGNGAVSTEHVLAELDMSALTPAMRAMLTQVLSGFTESQLARFLLFCSGQSRIPLPEKVMVSCGDEAGRLPTAHTCSPISLLLQPCSTVAELQGSLEACLSHASEFGFV